MKILFITLLFLSSLFAGFEKVRIGEISREYEDKITYSQLREIIDDIEKVFESQLGFNVFDYSNDGKPIHLTYLEPTLAQKRLERKINNFEKKKDKISKLKEFFPSKKLEIDTVQEEYNIQSKILNKKIENLNRYVREVNKIKQYPKKEYDEIKNYIKVKKDDIKKETKLKRKLASKLRKSLNQYNNKIHSFNNLVKQSQILANEIESLQRSLKVVKGRAFGQIQTIEKTYIKDGKKFKETTTQSSMDKIEIYSFENLDQLKAVLAHEIAHLVGIPHINDSNALMNPILQKNQEKDLFLTRDDIRNFNENF